MKGKTVAFMVLLVVMAGSIIATVASTTPISFTQPVSFLSIFGIGNIGIALADPIGGGPGGGGQT